MFLFAELKQYLPGGERLDAILVGAIQRLGHDAGEQTGHGVKVQDAQLDAQKDLIRELRAGCRARKVKERR